MLPSASQSSLQSQPSPKLEHVGAANEHTIQSISNNFNGLSVDPSSYQGNNAYSQPTTGNVNQQAHDHDMFYPNVNPNLQNTSMGSVASSTGFNWSSNPASPAQPR